MKVDSNGRITRFLEKPAPDLDITDWKIPTNLISPDAPDKEYLASMGIYIFDAPVMDAALDNTYTDFGKEIIPEEIATRRVQSFMHYSYWEDIGTIRSFYEANINLTAIKPDFNFYDESRPIYSSQPNLPPSKVNRAAIIQSITSEGCVISNAKISNSVIGVRTVIEEGSVIDRIVCMGADYSDTPETQGQGVPPLGIGKNCRIAGAIIDKNVRIGDNCSIGMDTKGYQDKETSAYQIVDGIIVVKKDAVIPSNTVI
jgi:glucose-1-phosphate adenylyltransferase